MRVLETLVSRAQPSPFWDGQGAENEFKVICEPLKHRFFELNQDAFWAG